MKYFSKFEIGLWFSSAVLILLSFFIFDKTNYLTLAASLIGVTSLILAALTDISYISVIICFVVFLVNDLYGFISWKRMSARQNNG